MKKVNYFDEHLPKRVVHAFLFSVMFMIIGRSVPDFYYRFIDKTNYITFSQPISFNRKTIHKCDTIISTTRVYSKLDLNIILHTKIIRIYKDGKLQGIYEYPQSKTFIRKTIKDGVVYVIPFSLPCKAKYKNGDPIALTPGIYFLEAIVNYEVYGYQKTYGLITDQITIIEDKDFLPPDTINSSPSAALK